MKRVIKLTESDLRGIIKKSVNKILKEAEDFDADGLRDSLMAYIKNPVDINKDVDYDPSDEEIANAIGDFDFDTDFSDLMGGQYCESRRIRGRKLTEGRLRRIVKESVNKVLREGELDYVPSASDYEGIEDNGLDSYDGFYNYDNTEDYYPEFEDFNIDYNPEIDADPDEFSAEDLATDYDGVVESRRLGKIVRESIGNVLRNKKRAT